MLEFPTVQQRGFRNVVESDTIVGFQVPVRLKYYRGVWLSQLRPATVIVDGKQYGGEQVGWLINGRTFEQADLADHGDVHWSNQEPALLVVRKRGGLTPGIHEVDVEFQTSTSYLPPRIDLQTWGHEPRRIVLVR